VSAPLLLAVFVGGGTGAACRYGVGRFVGERYGGAFPLGTFLINVTGCFALGLLATALAATHRDVALPTALLGTGFLGGYTTFSTYALEGLLLYNEGSRRLAVASLLGPVVAGLLAAAAGAGVARLAYGG
jgi:fluoride exporter